MDFYYWLLAPLLDKYSGLSVEDLELGHGGGLENLLEKFALKGDTQLFLLKIHFFFTKLTFSGIFIEGGLVPVLNLFGRCKWFVRHLS